jgi:hypothetical protein
MASIARMVAMVPITVHSIVNCRKVRKGWVMQLTCPNTSSEEVSAHDADGVSVAGAEDVGVLLA